MGKSGFQLIVEIHFAFLLVSSATHRGWLKTSRHFPNESSFVARVLTRLTHSLVFAPSFADWFTALVASTMNSLSTSDLIVCFCYHTPVQNHSYYSNGIRCLLIIMGMIGFCLSDASLTGQSLSMSRTKEVPWGHKKSGYCCLWRYFQCFIAVTVLSCYLEFNWCSEWGTETANFLPWRQVFQTSDVCRVIKTRFKCRNKNVALHSLCKNFHHTGQFCQSSRIVFLEFRSAFNESLWNKTTQKLDCCIV